jgi:hypothetical protein
MRDSKRRSAIGRHEQRLFVALRSPGGRMHTRAEQESATVRGDLE